MSEIHGTGMPASVSGNPGARAGWLAAGGVLGALATMSCCILPLVLFSLGITGAWIGRLAALSPYQPVLIVLTAGFLGGGYWLVYRTKEQACSTGGKACARPMGGRIVKGALWLATLLVGLAVAWPFIVPLLLA